MMISTREQRGSEGANERIGKKSVTNEQDSGKINARCVVISKPIGSPIELGHPADVALGGKELSQRQQKLLNALPGFGDSVTVSKKDVSMLDLSALTGGEIGC